MKNYKTIPDCKVTLVGDSGVGKSCIIGRYISGIFRNDSLSSASANYSQKIFENKNERLKLQIWDTAGQEKFRALGRNFYKDAYIICIVFDITNKQSFENVKEVWYPEIQNYGEKNNILSIVGNKFDLYEDEEVNEKEIKFFAEQIGGKYFLVSAKNGKGIDEMFKTLAKMYLSPNFRNKLNESRSSIRSSVQLNRKLLNKRNKKENCC